MTFGSATCEVCKRITFKESDVIAYRLTASGVEFVDLAGREPWSGIRCVCRECVDLLRWRARVDPSTPP